MQSEVLKIAKKHVREGQKDRSNQSTHYLTTTTIIIIACRWSCKKLLSDTCEINMNAHELNVRDQIFYADLYFDKGQCVCITVIYL